MFATIVILAFMVLEISNVVALYFTPGSKYANAVGVFPPGRNPNKTQKSMPSSDTLFIGWLEQN